MQFVQVVNGTQDDLYTVESYLRTFLASDQGNAQYKPLQMSPLG